MNHNLDLDLKVLKVVHILCENGSVTKTAKVLNVSPGAISYLINKARKSTGSALFIRTKNGMVADTIAHGLSERYLNVSQKLDVNNEEKIAGQRNVLISAYTIVELLVSLSMLKSVTKKPLLTFTPSLDNAEERLIKLRNKEVDIDIGTRLSVDKSIIQVGFFSK